MADGDSAPERRSRTPDGNAPAVGQRLRQLLAEMPTPFPCRYACFIHARRRHGEQGFGVITAAGESLPLTVEMLRSLERVPTLFDGRARVVVGPGNQEDTLIPAGEGGAWSVPLPVTRIVLRTRRTDPAEEGDGGGEGPVEWRTEQLLVPTADGPQMTLLCEARPAGWPA